VGAYPLLRRPSHRLSDQTKFLLTGTIFALAAGYFAFGRNDQAVDVLAAPQPKIDMAPAQFLPSRDRALTVESRAEPEVQSASLEPPARLQVKLTRSGGDVGPLQMTSSEGGQQLFAASHSTCFPSASAVRQSNPGGSPSWTLRAPGHEGTKCWHAARRATIEAEAPSARAKGFTVENRAEPAALTALSAPATRVEMKPTESGNDTRAPQPLPESHRRPDFQLKTPN
jgi:hypothetical protein